MPVAFFCNPLLETFQHRPLAGLLVLVLLVAVVVWLGVGVGVGVAVTRGRAVARRGGKRVRPSRSAVWCGAALWLLLPVVAGLLLFLLRPAPERSDRLDNHVVSPSRDPDDLQRITALLDGIEPATPNRDHPMLGLLPTRTAVPGWRPADAGRFLPAKELHKKIDGRDSVFLAHGVKGMVYMGFARGGGKEPELDIEIYDMATPAGARGIYDQERPKAVKPVSVGDAGYAVAGCVFLRQGRYYTRIISAAGDDRRLADAVVLAKAIAASQVAASVSQPTPGGPDAR